MLKEAEQAKKKLLAHAPANPSPLRRRISSRTVLASRLAATSLHSQEDADDTSGQTDQADAASSTASSPRKGDGPDKADDDAGHDAALLKAYRARVKSVLSHPAVVAV